MTEREADERAKVLNQQLGAAQDDQTYYMPIQASDGSWDIEKRTSKPGLLGRIIEAFPP
ncbi:MAG: hypothetical protein M3417_07470 [Actinomycetota bacterium]|nr:hypothetical protein [Actinomycetota bacterium]